MNRGCKRLIVPSACGAILLAMIAPSSAAGQRGGVIGGGGGDDYTSIGRGAAGMDRSVPGPEPLSPAASNPDIKAKLDHDQNIKDAALLVQLANEVNQELENGGASTLSVGSLKKLEEAAKLAKRLHDRIKTDNASAPKPGVGDATNRSAPKH
jgi:hypothetical protein